jgi:hypothetical protein
MCGESFGHRLARFLLATPGSWDGSADKSLLEQAIALAIVAIRRSSSISSHL